MGLITKDVEIIVHNKKIKYYENLGYNIPKIKGKWGLTVPHGSKIIVKVQDLSKGSSVNVDVECDNCQKILFGVQWQDYLKRVKKDSKYYCLQCAIKLYAQDNTIKTKLKNGKSFEQWCMENNRQDVLDRWDYELNDCKPSEVLYSSNKKYYLKCPRELHNSELKNIGTIIQNINFYCNQCNSFAQWGIDNICEDFLEKYWDYEKNIVDPFKIPSQWNKKVWIKCQEKYYHGSYDIKCNGFVGVNSRCPYCNKNSGKVHFLDSLGKLLKDKNLLYLWSNKNNKSPYKYAPFSAKKVYWKCFEGKHEDYYREIASSHLCDFRCPECQYSKGETVINDIFIELNWIKILQEKYDKLLDINKYNNKYFIPQKTFDGLVGLGGGLLSYDFYLPKYNLLIEYQGEFHDGTAYQQTKEDFEKQVEHDRRKKEYAEQNGYNFLEIWYWDFDKIEEIINNKLLELKECV